MFIEVGQPPKELKQIIEMKDQDIVTIIKSELKEAKKGLPKEYSSILDEAERAINEKEIFKAFYLLIIFQRTLQDTVKKAVSDGAKKVEDEKRVKDKVGEICGIFSKEQNITKMLEKLLGCSETVKGEIERASWNYTYEKLIEKLPQDVREWYKNVLRDIRIKSNRIVHNLYEQDELPEILLKLEMKDIFLLAHAVKIIIYLRANI